MTSATLHLSRILAAAAAASVLSIPAAALAQAADYYLKIGSIEGETTEAASDKARIAVIELHSWSWGETQTTGSHAAGMAAGKAAPEARAHDLRTNVVARSAPDVASPRDSASGMPTGKRQHMPIKIVTDLDESTPVLRLSAPLPRGSVTLVGRFSGCTVGTAYPSVKIGDGLIQYELKDVLVTSCASASSGGDQPMESVSLNYAKIEF